MPEFIHFCHKNFAYSNFEHNCHAPKSEFIHKIHQQVQPEKISFPHQMSLLGLFLFQPIKFSFYLHMASSSEVFCKGMEVVMPGSPSVVV